MTTRNARKHANGRIAAALALVIAAFAPATSGAVGSSGDLRAGVASIDASWHVGASQGQYADVGPGVYDSRTGGVDPFAHAVTSNATYGVESRTSVRALVLDDGDSRWALVTNDLYIPQDLVNQRVATLLAEHDLLNPTAATGITDDELTITVSHSHSSPYYSSTAWGAWAFQDTFDIRFFEFMARRMADAVIAAAADLRPVRAAVAATMVATSKRNPEAPAISEEDEPLPAAWPMTETDATLTVLRVDDLSGEQPTPLARWVVFGRHPEGMQNNGLHTSEYVGALMRTLDREEGGVTLFSQNDVGTSEVVRESKVHAPEARQEFNANSHNMLERVARQLADEVQAAERDVDRRWQDEDAALIKATSVALVQPNAPLGVSTMRFAPPSYRLFPSVSNCRTERAAEGDPGIPVIGLPDCTFFVPQEIPEASPVDPGVTYDTLREAGVPVPDNYGFPSYTGLQESVQVPLQAVRLGGVAFTFCPCEQFTDQTRNIRSRLDKQAGNLHLGWDWTANHRFNADWEPGVAYLGDLLPDAALGETVTRGPVQLDIDPQTPGAQWWCEPDDRSAPAMWTCKDPRVLSNREPDVLPSWSQWPTLAPVSHAAFVRWKARIYNDARGWDGYVGEDGSLDALEAEAEPADPTKVLGNWIHEELDEYGYDVVVPVSMANSYWGYIPTYREFQVRDYYRKALAGLGPHSSDFVTTRLTRMAAQLNGAPASLLSYSEKDIAYQPEREHVAAKATAIGQLAEAAMPVYEAALPADGGAPGSIRRQPSPTLKRFEVASMQWVGGSNYTDVPHARVERLDPSSGGWAPFGDGFGEVQIKVALPKPEQMATVAAGTFEWVWTAGFETYDSEIDHAFADGVRRDQVPNGTYRFVVDGCHRGALPLSATGPGCSTWDAAGRVSAYHAVSDPFTVGAWDGITVEGLATDGSGVSFAIGPKLPQPLEMSNSTLTPFTSSVGMLRATPLSYLTGRFDYTRSDSVDYPDSVSGHPFPYVRARRPDDLRAYPGARQELFCFLCSFEAWADTGAIARASVTVVRASGPSERIPATFDPTTGRWSANVVLATGDQAFVEAGDVVDTYGEHNGARSAVVTYPPSG